MKSRKLHSEGSKCDQAGFTIIEMLVGLSLTALVATLLVTGITQLRPIQERTDTQTLQQELNAAADYIERIVSDHRNLALLTNNPERAAFIGEKARVRFVAVVSTGSDLHQLRDVSFEVIDIGGKLTLQQSIQPRRLLSDQSMTETAAVMSSLSEIQFDYLSNVGQWSNEWPSSQRLPTAVKVTLKRVRGPSVISITRLIRLDQEPSSKHLSYLNGLRASRFKIDRRNARL